MRISRIEIRNFRSIQYLNLSLGETTVFVGPNNSGKTAILDAIRLSLPPQWAKRRIRFNKNDIRLRRAGDDPRQSDGATITLWMTETCQDMWPDSVKQSLSSIIALDAISGTRSICFRTHWKWNDINESFEQITEFLNPRGDLIPVQNKGLYVNRIRRLLPVFYLGALRDYSSEITSRSQYWKQLMEALEIPKELESEVQSTLEDINSKLANADKRVKDILSTLSKSIRVALHSQRGSFDLRLIPIDTRELVTRSELILRNAPTLPWLPLRYQGQGIQSLSVIFLYQAFIDIVLNDTYDNSCTPVIAIEEPEAHLHPQSERRLWHDISTLNGQKIVTTHSPYLVQRVPMRDLRMVDLSSESTIVSSLPRTFRTEIPHSKGIDDVIANNPTKFSFDRSSHLFETTGMLKESDYRALLRAVGNDTNRHIFENKFKELRDASSVYISDTELIDLETFALRIRGEILFARYWIIVEGQADYLVMHATASAMGYDLDELGVSVIDAKNNGSPSLFAALARALDILWLAVFDGDPAGNGYRKDLANRGFSNEELNRRCHLHEAGTLEDEILSGGLKEVVQNIRDSSRSELRTYDRSSKKSTLQQWMKKNKTKYAACLAARIQSDSLSQSDFPKAFRVAVAQAIEEGR